MYEQYYGFVQPPFTLTPDPRFLYRSESHEEAITLLQQAIRRKEGFIVLTGDIGTGKTTSCRALLEQLDAAPPVGQRCVGKPLPLSLRSAERAVERREAVLVALLRIGAATCSG